jgi:hypothetical protein
MADFVAVIRRAVDGLANNTPEMRAKVYEKARGAVLRQLENMKPRPPEEMLRRQIDKLDAAIAEVEQEHAEALPSLDEVDDPVDAQQDSAEDQWQAEGDDSTEPAPAAEPVPPAVYDDAPLPEPAEAEEPVALTPAPVEPAYAPPEWDEPKAEEPEPAVEPAPLWVPDPEPEPAPVVAAAVSARAEPAFEETRYAEPAESPSAGDEHLHDTTATVSVRQPADAWSWPEDVDGKAAEPTPAPYAAGLASHATVHKTHDAQPPLDDFDAYVNGGSDFIKPDSLPTTSVKMPEAIDLLAYEPEVVEPAQPPRPVVAAAAPVPPKPAVSDPWNDLEELIGYDRNAKTAAAPQPAPIDAPKPLPTLDPHPDYDFDEDFSSDVQMPAGKSFHVSPKKPKRNYIGLLLGLLVLLILAGGGYALWLNRDAMSDMVAGLVQTSGTTTPPASTPVATPSATPAAAPATGTAQTAPAAAKPTTANGQAAVVAANDGTARGTKFTQRLRPDGTEINDGPAVPPAGAIPAEGQSVAQQNVAAAAPAAPAAAPVTQPAAAAAPAAAPAATPAPSAAQASAGAPQKMFLYEERLGQTAPTAIEGTVTWSLQQEAGEGGKPEPTVQGQVSIPDRGLTALITVKRNTDASLPASHLVELVFSLPADFEGGAIDSVQRIAMKQTEQDRGNALIAVPAKITDDFHMIALNDFPDARATNLELLRSRNWMDIPLTYRNGRRALLTMQKGADGITAFDTAIRAWASLGDAASR